jgi:hypothetical protein
MAKANDLMLKEDRELLTARFETRRQAWEKASRHGIVFFIFTRWILWCVGVNFLVGLAFNELPGMKKPDSAQAIEVFVLLFIVAVLAGIWDWHVREKRYGKSAEVTGRD